jgi:hypothetical protein
MVHDRGLARLSLFDASGTLVRTIDNAGSDRCCVAGTHYLIANTSLPLAVDPVQAPSRDSMRIDIRRIGTINSHRLVALPGYERPYCIGPMMNGRCGGIGGLLRPFVSQPSVATAGDVFIYASGESYEYRVYSADGVLLRIVRAALSPARVTAAEMDSAKNHILGHHTDQTRATAEAAWARIPRASTRPAFEFLSAENDGSVWIAGCAGQSGLRCWARFNPDGRLAGTLLVPEGWNVSQFGNGHVTLFRDDPATQSRTIAVHRVERM